MPVSSDPAAFRQLFREHAPFVWRVLRRFGVAPSDLDDVCQEVFVVVHRGLASFEGRSSLRTWLYEIARRAALAQRRGRLRGQALPLDAALLLDDPAPLPLEQLEQSRALRWLSSALAQLSADKREAFVLYELEDMTLAEVSQALNVPLNTIHYRVQTARAGLQKLAQRDGQPLPTARASAREGAR